MSKQNKLFALIKWIGSVDDESYVIEWRDQRKEPFGGWKVYDGLVIAVSVDRNCEKPQTCQKEKCSSKSLPDDPGFSRDLSHLTTESTNFVKKQLFKSPSKPVNQKKTLNTANSEENLKRSKKGKHSSFLEDDEYLKYLELSSREETTLKRKKEKVSEKSESVKEGMDSHKKSKLEKSKEITLDDVEQFFKNYRKPLAGSEKHENMNSERNSQQSHSGSDDDEKNENAEQKGIEIGRKGSKVYISARQYKYALQRSTASAMATALVDALFSLDVLLISNLKGGKRKIPVTNGVAMQHQALDENILQLIYDEVEKIHPNTFNSARLGGAINGHLNYLRTQYKRNKENNRKNDGYNND